MMGHNGLPPIALVTKDNDSCSQDIVDGTDHSDNHIDNSANPTPHDPWVDSDFDDEDGNNNDDDETIDTYLDRELDREIEEMIQNTQKQLDEELRRQIDERLQAELDQQMEDHFAELEESFQRQLQKQRQDRHEYNVIMEGGQPLYKQQQEKLGGPVVTNNEDVGSCRSSKPTVVEINTQIEEIINRYASTITLGSSDQTKLGDQG